MHVVRCVSAVLLLMASGSAAPKIHTIVLGKAATINVGGRAVRVRPLLVDDRVREYTAGAAHEVTDRMFVIRRAYRLNDSLPAEDGKPARWIWQLGGWISVNRQNGHIALLNLPLFDPQTSEASWFRDYAAYCGSSDDGSKAYAVVFQMGRKKPLLKQEFPGETCPAPGWEREPLRVTFDPPGVEKASFLVKGRSAEPETAEGGDDESQR